jgi:transposase-like protein
VSNFSYYRNGVNKDIYQAKGNIPFWVIANHLGVHENTVRNWLKSNISDARKKEIFKVIAMVKSEVEKDQ